jgi:cytidylate kinase
MRQGMFPSFVSVMECVNAPSAECMLAPPALIACAAALVAAAFGWWMATRHGRTFKRILGRLLLAALDIMFTSVVVIVAFFHFRPDAPLGVERVPAWAVLWEATIYAFGIGFVLFAAAAGYGLGGLAARAFGFAPRLGRPGVVIAIDGPAASGKGTLAKRIADHFAIPCLDTGLLYRAVARDVLHRGGKLDDAITAIACARALDPRTFEDPALRGATAGEAASVVARIPEVREALLEYQRDFAKAKFGAVLDGRDIGTVVCPDAEVKIFVIASPEERARRRHKELQQRGENVPFDDVLEDIHRRDTRDMGREISPLWPAKDAITLDTTEMDADRAFAEALRIIDFRLNGSVPA